jgi:hypothetical protein
MKPESVTQNDEKLNIKGSGVYFANPSVNRTFFSQMSSFGKNTIIPRAVPDNGFNMTMQATSGSQVTTRVSNVKTPISFLRALD